MRYLTICILWLFVSLAEAGESPANAPATNTATASEQWVFCRLRIARPGRPPGSLDIVVYTCVTPRGKDPGFDTQQAFTEFVRKTYGIEDTDAECAVTNTEAGARQSLAYLTTNKENPSQIQVVETGWTHQAP